MSENTPTIFGQQINRASVHRNTYRIICVLASVLTPAFGIFYQVTDPTAFDPLWARFGVGLVALLLLVGSYMNKWIENNFIDFAHILFYLLLTYYVGVTALNEFSSNYTIGMLFAITAMEVAFSLGLRQMSPLVRYLAASVVVVVPTVFLMPSEVSPIIVSVCTVSTAVVIYIVARAKIEAEKSMKASEHRYFTLMNSAEDAIFIIDSDTERLIDANNKAQELTGQSHEELRQMRQPDLFPPNEQKRYSAIFTDHAVNNTVITDDLYLIHKEGYHTPVDLSASLISVGDKKLIQGIFRDATQRHQYEKKLIQAKERAEELLQLKSSLLNNMSHELRTPLTGILGFAEILVEEATEAQQQFAQTICDSATRLMKTLNSVLDLAQLESGEIQFEVEVVNVANEVREAVALLRPLADQNGLDLEMKVISDDNTYVKIDQTCLTRIVNNLVGNALKFTKEGGVTVTIIEDESLVSMIVQDTGVGIEEAFMEHLFEAFRQESTGLSRSHEGTGLGLTITNRLVNFMDGSIEVESEKGKGSTFTVSFPRVLINGNTTNGTAPDTYEEAITEDDLHEALQDKLLVVEDNRETRDLIRLRLRSKFEVVCTSDPMEALQLADEMHFNGFLLDIGLGADHDGIDVLQALRETSKYSDTPAVALTAYAMPGDEERFLAAGFDYYLSKPFTKEQFLEVVDRAFAPVYEPN